MKVITTGRTEYFDKVDAILGTRARSTPVALMDFNALDNNGVDSDETQAEDPDLTFVPEVNDHSLVIPDSLEPEGWCSMQYNLLIMQ